MKAYHISRKNLLKNMTEINLKIFTNNLPKELRLVIKNLYPEGFSKHGERYFLSQVNSDFIPEDNIMNTLYAIDSRDAKISAYIIENIFEYERILFYPNMFSRFQSFFVSNNKKNLEKWLSIKTFKKSDYQIYEVEIAHNNYVTLDSNWLSCNYPNISMLTAKHNAKMYWSGKASKNPMWETLVKPKIKIIGEVNHNIL